jgi:hypothetical protein
VALYLAPETLFFVPENTNMQHERRVRTAAFYLSGEFISLKGTFK